VTAWVWLDVEALRVIQARDGGAGVRNEDALAATLARPQQLAAQFSPDASALAAAYGYGLSRNRPFSAGNTQMALIAVELFLARNGFALQASDSDCVLTFLAVAAGDISEADFAGWIRDCSVIAQ
jgi:death on curing protein